MFCPKCGKKNIEEALFCCACGNKFAESVAANAPIAVEPAAVTATEPIDSELELAADSQQIINVGDWILMWFIMSLPIAGLIMTIVWAFSKRNRTRANFCKAALIVAAIITVLTLLFSVLSGVACAKACNSCMQECGGSEILLQ